MNREIISKMSQQEMEKGLLKCLRAMGMPKECMMVVLSFIHTKNQQVEMMDWIADNYQNNPTYRDVNEKAEEIAKRIPA